MNDDEKKTRGDWLVGANIFVLKIFAKKNRISPFLYNVFFILFYLI